MRSIHTFSVMDYTQRFLKNNKCDFFTSEKDLETRLHESATITSYGYLLTSFIHKLCEKRKLYVLVDFCQMYHITEEILTFLLQLVRIPHTNLRAVVALTSGAGQTADTRSFSEQIDELVKSVLPTSIMMNGFTDAEAKKFLEVNKIQVKFEDIKLYSGNNPYCHLVYTKVQFKEQLVTLS